MRDFDRLSKRIVGVHHASAGRVLAMMGLYFLVVLTIGIIRPIRDGLALDGLADGDFFKVYLVSGVVVLFVPLYNKLAERFPWRVLVPVVALFFASNLVLFWLFFREGSATYGMVFYGWYDLYAAALVTQFFIATQLFFDARDAKGAYPMVIAAGSIGATLGSGITAFFVGLVGDRALLLLAAGLITVFAAAVPLVLRGSSLAPRRAPGRTVEQQGPRGLRRILGNRHVRMIAGTVLLTVIVKQLIDYQFKEIVGATYGDRESIAAFMGVFYAATQWLPFVVVLAIRPLMQRWGVGAALFLLPAFMLMGNVGLAVSWTIGFAVFAKASDSAFRYSAERAARELLYIPVPSGLKMEAKSFVDIAVEKGIGKVASAILVFLFVDALGLDYRRVAWVGIGLGIVWLSVAVVLRERYVASPAEAIRTRVASARGLFASIADGSTAPALRAALASPDPLQVGFALDLMAEAPRSELSALAAELGDLVGHRSAQVRERALGLLTRHSTGVPGAVIRPRLEDPSPGVREAAVRALCSTGPDDNAEAEIATLLGSEDRGTRVAALRCLLRGELTVAANVDARALLPRGAIDGALDTDPGLREERALALGLTAPPALGSTGADAAGTAVPGAGTLTSDGVAALRELIADPSHQVARAALLSAGALRASSLYPRMIDALGSPAIRSEARRALERQGKEAIDALAAALADETLDRRIRVQVPGVLAAIPFQRSVDVLLRSLAEPSTDQRLDFFTLKALNKLRVSAGGLKIDPAIVIPVANRAAETARSYAVAHASLNGASRAGPVCGLLRQGLREAWEQRREEVCRCLGLVYPPAGMRHVYIAVTGAGDARRANALEWLERTAGRSAFAGVSHVFTQGPPEGSVGPDADALELQPDPTPHLARLSSDRNEWIAQLAHCAALELRAEPFAEDPGMDVIEKVGLLQQVDLLRGAPSEDLAILASIAEVVEVERDTVLLHRDEPNEALYVVIEGSVRVSDGDMVVEADGRTAFGTWALIDSEPSPLEARAAEPGRLLRITQVDFRDLLTDHPELAVGMLQGLASRVRTLLV